MGAGKGESALLTHDHISMLFRELPSLIAHTVNGFGDVCVSPYKHTAGRVEASKRDKTRDLRVFDRGNSECKDQDIDVTKYQDAAYSLYLNHF